MPEKKNIKAIVGLGNPGQQFVYTRHNIGFRIVDALADQLNAKWQTKDFMEIAKAQFNNNSLIIIKPQTFMNSSGKIWPYLSKQGILPEELLVVHDELELPFGKIALKTGGSAKGHNGLKSIISFAGDKFERLRFGIARPENKDDVPNYVLAKFKESENDIQESINNSVDLILSLIS